MSNELTPFQIENLTDELITVMSEMKVNRVNHTFSVYRVAVKRWSRSIGLRVVPDEEWAYAERAMSESNKFTKDGRSVYWLNGRRRSFAIWTLKSEKQNTPTSISDVANQKLINMGLL